MMDLLFKVQKYMNGEDALMAKGLTGKIKIVMQKLRLVKVA